MNSINLAFWNICDSLAGKVDEPCAATAFVIAADTLPATNEWRLSTEYQTAKQTIEENEKVNKSPVSDYCCKSVLGGWQTFDNVKKEFIGPTFSRTTDLWKWQRENIAESEKE